MGILLFILKLLLLIFILGIIILVHEFGHFIWAKHFGVHIYEFSIGMGPLLFTKKGKKDGIDYNVRAIPIGGFVSMAGEVYADDDEVPKEKLLCNMPAWKRFIILVAGVTNNFILAIVCLMIFAGFFGGGAVGSTIDYVTEGSAAQMSGLKANDKILKINGYSAKNWDSAQIILYFKDKDGVYDFTIKHEDGKVEDIKITPNVVKNEETGEEQKVFGIAIKAADTSNIFKVIAYGFTKFWAVITSMVYTIFGLITGKVSLNALSGPVGIFEVVGGTFGLKFTAAVSYVIYLIAYLSCNVGFINILPFPAFDGGHVFFLLVEKIKGSPVNAKFENTCHLVGFALIFLLMIVVTINDILKLF